MDPPKGSPFPSTTEVPLHRNAPLAPSQEMAYRKKCIQLKRRLTEIEANNDSTRKRIAQEKEHVQKMRLLRAILLDHLKTIMETPGKKLTPEQLEKIGVLANGAGHEAELVGMQEQERPVGEGLLDDSSDESDENEPEPLERPERRRRTNNNYRESIMNTASTPTAPSQTSFQAPSNLPSLAPASSFSPAAVRDPAMLTSSFRVSATTPQASTTPAAPYGVAQPQFAADGSYGQHSSPIPATQSINMPYQSTPHGQTGTSAMSLDSTPVAVNGIARPGTSSRPMPQRPPPPFEQFTDHMRPQLEADNYPPDQITTRIQTEWDNLSAENRNLWDIRYREQMMEFTTAMDEWKGIRRREGASGGVSSAGASFSSNRG